MLRNLVFIAIFALFVAAVFAEEKKAETKEVVKDLESAPSHGWGWSGWGWPSGWGWGGHSYVHRVNHYGWGGWGHGGHGGHGHHGGHHHGWGWPVVHHVGWGWH